MTDTTYHGFETTYDAALSIDMTTDWAMSMDESTAQLIEVRAAAAHLSTADWGDDLATLQAYAARREVLEGAYWERAYRGEDLCDLGR